MSARDPFRWKPHWKTERVDETRCRASVANGRAGVAQCGNKPKKGTEWCAAHTPDVIPDDADALWSVFVGYGGGKPEMASVPVAKETKKQIRLAEMHQAFDYKQRIDKLKDGAPSIGFRTRLEAAQGYVKRCKDKAEAAREAVIAAERRQKEAEALLAKVEKEER